MRLLFSSEAWADYRFWLESDEAIFRRLNQIIDDTRQTPFSGIGKPEPLRHKLAGYWSRRITIEHRFIYQVEGSGDTKTLLIAACRYHYGKR